MTKTVINKAAPGSPERDSSRRKIERSARARFIARQINIAYQSEAMDLQRAAGIALNHLSFARMAKIRIISTDHMSIHAVY
jgi:hypothetical protein